MAEDWLESEEFYNAMQRYRIASPLEQREVVACFENVKRLIRIHIETERGELLAVLKEIATHSVCCDARHIADAALAKVGADKEAT